MTEIAPQSLFAEPDGVHVVSEPGNAPAVKPGFSGESQAAAHAARLWVVAAMRTVEAVFPAVNWGTDVTPEVDAAWEDAIEARFWLKTMSTEDFQLVWRRWYWAHM